MAYDQTGCERTCTCTVRAPVFDRHQVFGTSEHYGKAHGSLLCGWRNYNYTACCWFPTSSNILILPSQFWQIGFESCWLHCSKCRILVLLWYILLGCHGNEQIWAALGYMYEASTHKNHQWYVDGHTPFGPLYSLSVVDVKLLSKEFILIFFFTIVV